ncbi:MAG: leucine-rich repeat domain-containing protein [Planctomycetota bacterium]|jgi:hypothetical protein
MDLVLQTRDLNGDGSEQVTLDGSGSADSDGTIQSYVWTEGGIQIATGQAPTITLAVGIHDIKLTVTDDDGDTDTDTVTITINSAPAVYFADPNLKAAVEAQLGVSDPTTADMLALTVLHAGGMGITDLTGLEYGINLTVLKIHNNQISDISPLSGLTNLTDMNLEINSINDISALAGLTNLEYLCINQNQISNISVLAALINLKVLFLYENQISDISALAGLTNLYKLRSYGNQISNISALAGLTNLTTLTLGNNQISDISVLASLTKLKNLHLYDNQISDISALAGLTSLEWLELDNNQISDISPISGLMNFTHLDLQVNPLNSDAYSTHIPQILSNNPGMTLLYDPQGTGSISGYKFEDINANGVDDSELRLSNWTIELYLDNGDGLFNETTPIDTQITSSPDGAYSFSYLGVGNYWVREVQQSGWIQTTADPSLIVIVSGTTITEANDPGLAFGNGIQSTELLSEDFNDGNYDGWSLVEQATMGGPMDWSVVNGVMIQSSNVHSPPPHLVAKLGTFAYWQAGLGWTDYTATVTMKSTDNDALGVMFRYQDDKNYYRFIWDKERNSRALVKCDDGVFTILAEDSIQYAIGQSYQVEIIAHGSSLQVSIDGSPVFSVTDSTFSSGTIALYSWGNSGSHFDDILVESIP